MIAALEELQRNGSGQLPMTAKRRGRKSMSSEERQEVSARMQSYWASRRKAERQG
jgi:hypothetical protein